MLSVDETNFSRSQTRVPTEMPIIKMARTRYLAQTTDASSENLLFRYFKSELRKGSTITAQTKIATRRLAIKKLINISTPYISMDVIYSIINPSTNGCSSLAELEKSMTHARCYPLAVLAQT